MFVAGNGRSGTSWIGETLGRPGQVLYYREPCHPMPTGCRACCPVNPWHERDGPVAREVARRPRGGREGVRRFAINAVTLVLATIISMTVLPG